MLYGKRDRIQKDYDVIVIGGGLAGLTAANRLAKQGRSVLLLEAHNKLGGFATWFRRKNEHVFDVSLHGFPVGMIKTCKKYWNKEIAGAIEQVKSVRFINPQFDLETDFTKEHYTKLLIEHFKLSHESVNGFFTALEQMNFYDDQSLTNGDLFQKFFPDRNDVVRFLLEPIVYANGSTLEDPAISYGIVFSNFMSKGVYIFKGGTDKLVSMMKDELISNNVDIKLHSKVDSVEIIDGVVVGVRLEGELIRAKAVLSNSHLCNTIFKLAKEENFSSEYIEQARKVRPNTSSCQVFMGLKLGETLPEMGDLIFYSEDEKFNTDLILSPKLGSQTFSIYYPDMRPDRPPYYAVVSSSNARYEYYKGLTEEQYLAQKKYNEEKALSVFEKLVPGFREKVDVIDSSTPLTVERYTHHTNGASFGTKFEGLPLSMNMHKEINGLFHAGSVGIIMSGWLGAANYGVIQAHEVDTYLDKWNQKNEETHAQL